MPTHSMASKKAPAKSREEQKIELLKSLRVTRDAKYRRMEELSTYISDAYKELRSISEQIKNIDNTIEIHSRGKT